MKIVTTVNVDTLEESSMTDEQKADVESIKAKAAANGTIIAQVLDLSVQITTFVNGNVPDGYSRSIYVILVHDDKIETIEATINEDGTISFAASKFSTYALAYKDVKETVPAPQPQPQAPQKPAGNAPTGDTAPVMLYVSLAMASLMALVVVEIKRRKVF